MFYNVAQLLREPVGATRTYRLDHPVSSDGGDFHIFPQGQLSMMRVDRGIWVSASVAVRVGQTCSRCLKRFHYPLNIAIEEEYLPTVDINTGKSLPVPEMAEGSFTIDKRHLLDLSEAVRQYAITSQPMKPLCRQDCQGLCPICGMDRSDNHCTCMERDVDARWVPLVQLLGQNNR